MKAKDRNKQMVLDTAKKVFLEKGISGVSMNDIAEATGFGIASVYRYFGNKNALVIECAASLWDDRAAKINKVYQRNVGLQGYRQLSILIKYYPWLIVGDKAFSKFLISFDAFLVDNVNISEELAPYETVTRKIYEMFETAYNQGLKDGTVRDVGRFEDYYFVATQALLSLAQKLAVRGSIVKIDRSPFAEKINMLITMYTDYIKVK